MNNWPSVKLADICVGLGKYGLGISGTYGEASGPRYIRITDIDDEGNLSDNDVKYISSAEASNYLLNEGDLIFARSGTVGRTYLHKGDFNAAFASYLIRFCPDRTKVLPEYLFAYTHSINYKKWIASITQTGGQPNINAQKYASMHVILPSLPEQQKIVEILFDFDATINKTLEQLNLLKQQKRGLMQQLLTGKLYVKGTT